MTFHRWICMLGLALAVLCLGGCSKDYKSVQENSVVLEQIKNESSGKAVQMLEARLRKSDPLATDVCDFPSWCGVDFRESRRAIFNELRKKIEESTASTMTTAQLLTYVGDYEMGTTREVIGSEIVRRATRVGDDRESVPLLDAAGMLLARGEFVMRNADAAIAILNRSWMAGSKEAAEQLAVLYSDTGDLGNAYLWSVRSKKPGFAGLSRIKDLSPEAIRKAEAAAAKPSILSIH